MRRFSDDTAQISQAMTLGALVMLVPISQIVYGTDYPYRTGADHTKGVTVAFSEAELMAIDRDNANRLIPRRKA